jgi:uncharacterized tellurite resistance protein B-like protein
MLFKIKNLLAGEIDKNDSSGTKNISLAICVLLLEVAKVDGEFDDEEFESILDTMHFRFKLSDEESEELISIANTTREKKLDIFPFTHLLNNSLDKEKRIEVLEEIWRVVYADGKLDAHEDYLVHKLAKLLNLRHSELIEAKLIVLEEMRNPE